MLPGVEPRSVEHDQVEAGASAVEIVASGRARATRSGARQAPAAPGCYVFRDAEGAPLYVGKSVALRTRLASYFAAQRDGKARAMLKHARDVEWHTVGSEVEALILESQLVKRLRPPYNVLLREYPHYTFLRLNDGGGFPYLELCRSVAPDGAGYFGPFWGDRSAEQTMEFANRLFALRRCVGPLPPPQVGQGCFYAQTRRCSAPCLGRATGDDYGGQVRSASDLLRGDVGRLIARLERERNAAAEDLRFEQAAALQQTIETLQALRRKRRHLRSAAHTVNFLVVVRHASSREAQVLAFSAARLRGQVSLPVPPAAGWSEALLTFLLEQYPTRRELTIDLDELDQMHVVSEWLARQGRQAAYVALPDGPLCAQDARRAVDAVAHVLGPTV